jgi:hypothetical protein
VIRYCFLIAVAILAIALFTSPPRSSEDETHGSSSEIQQSLNDAESLGSLNDQLVNRTTVKETRVIPRDLIAEMTALVNKSLYQDGGRKRSLDFLGKLTDDLIESKKRAPFEAILLSLREKSSVEVPPVEILWTLSIVEMENVRDLLNRHDDWLRKQQGSWSDEVVRTIRSEMEINSLAMPPEAVTMGLTGESWSQLVLDFPGLKTGLGQIRTKMVLEHAAYQKEIWLTHSIIYQASLQLEVELDSSQLQLEQLSAFYPPLKENLDRLASLQQRYRNEIAAELMALGVKVTPLN